MKHVIFIAIFAMALMGSTSKHEYYVSVAQVEYNPETDWFEVAIKVFTDDFEAALKKASGETMPLSDKSMRKKIDEACVNYLEEKFLFIKKKKILKQIFLGYEAGEDETWLYMQIKGAPVGMLTIKNTVLMEVFKDQVNIMHIKVEGNNQSHYFSIKNPMIEIEL